MDPRQKQVRALKEQIGHYEAQLGQVFSRIGRHLHAQGMKKASVEQYCDAYEKLEARSAGKQRAESLVSEIEKRTERLEQISGSLQANEGKITEIRKTLTAQYRSLGETAHEAYQQRCSEEQKERYREVLDDILKLDEELDQLSKELNELETQSKGVFDKFSKLFKGMGKRRDLKRAAASRDQGLIAAGEKVADSDFASAVGDATVSQRLSETQELRDQIEAVRSDSTELTREKERIDTELGELGVQTTALSRIDALRIEIKRAETEFSEHAIQLGRIFYENKLKDELCDEGALPLLKEADHHRNSIELNRTQIERLNAELETDSLKQRLSELQQKQRRLTQEVEQRKRESSEIEIELQRIRDRLDELRNTIESATAAAEASAEASAPSPGDDEA